MFNPLSILSLISELNEENAMLTDQLATAQNENLRLKAQIMPQSDAAPNTENVACSIGKHEMCTGITTDTEGTTIQCECTCHAVGDEK